MAGLKLYTCHVDRDGPAVHPCRRCHEALEEAGHIIKWAKSNAPATAEGSGATLD